MKTFFVVTSVLALLCMAIAAQALVTVYTNRSAWELALGGSYSEEFFSDATLNAGVSVVSTLPGYIDVTKGVWWDSLYGPNGTGGPTSTTWQFGASMTGFGGNWDCAAPGGPGAGIEASDGSSSWVLVGEIPTTYAGGFWGFVSSDSFSQVRLQCGGGSGWTETYELDNMVYSSVPEPSSLAALVAGLAAFIGTRRRGE